MGASEWFRWAAAFVLGALSTIAIEFGRGQFERRQRREDRRDDFRREKMIELLKPTNELLEFVRRFHYPRVDDYWNHGDWPYSPDEMTPLTAEQFFEHERITVEARILSHLTADEDIDRLVETLLSSARGTIGAETYDEAHGFQKAATEAFLSFSKRVGELQGKL